MRGLALCLVAGALAITGCGSSDNASAPKQEKVTASGGSRQPAAVSAKGPATPNSLCTAEGKGKPKKQCVKALNKLNKGKAANPKAACKGMSKKKTKGVRGKSPFAVCVTAAAKLMASKSSGATGNGAADSTTSSDSSSANDNSDSSDSSGGNDTSDQGDIVCHDDNGNVVPIDSDNVADCDVPDDGTSASDSSADSSSADDTSTDSSDSSDSSDGN